MAISSEFKAFVCDLFSDLGEVSTRHLFGGAGLYCQGVMFAMINDDQLYLKVNAIMQAELAELGCAPFMVDFGKGEEARPMMGYWSMPASAMDNPDEACALGRRALEFAHKKASKKRKSG